MSRLTGLNIKRSKAEDARFDAIGLCLARLMDDALGDGKATYMQSMMGDLIQEPERLGGATLTILGMLQQLSNARPGGWGLLCDSLIDAIPESG